jgi:hypothetical protein
MACRRRAPVFPPALNGAIVTVRLPLLLRFPYPGMQAIALAAPRRFAGEACSLDYFSTAHGTFLAGVPAADDALAVLGMMVPRAV